MFNAIDMTAKALIANGIRQGDYVVICLPNIPEFVYFTYALNRIGAVACLIDPRTNAEGILEKVNEAAAKLFICISDIINSKIAPMAFILPDMWVL